MGRLEPLVLGVVAIHLRVDARRELRERCAARLSVVCQRAARARVDACTLRACARCVCARVWDVSCSLFLPQMDGYMLRRGSRYPSMRVRAALSVLRAQPQRACGFLPARDPSSRRELRCGSWVRHMRRCVAIGSHGACERVQRSYAYPLLSARLLDWRCVPAPIGSDVEEPLADHVHDCLPRAVRARGVSRQYLQRELGFEEHVEQCLADEHSGTILVVLDVREQGPVAFRDLARLEDGAGLAQRGQYFCFGPRSERLDVLLLLEEVIKIGGREAAVLERLVRSLLLRPTARCTRSPGARVVLARTLAQRDA